MVECQETPNLRQPTMHLLLETSSLHTRCQQSLWLCLDNNISPAVAATAVNHIPCTTTCLCKNMEAIIRPNGKKDRNKGTKWDGTSHVTEDTMFTVYSSIHLCVSASPWAAWKARFGLRGIETDSAKTYWVVSQNSGDPSKHPNIL